MQLLSQQNSKANSKKKITDNIARNDELEAEEERANKDVKCLNQTIAKLNEEIGQITSEIKNNKEFIDNFATNAISKLRTHAHQSRSLGMDIDLL